MQELTDAIRLLTKGKAVGPDEVSVKLFKTALKGYPALPSSSYSTTKMIEQSAATTGVSHW